MGRPIRVLVVEDSAFMRRALARRIELDSRFCVIDTAQDGREGVEKALRLQPDVVTLDVEMPVLNGLDALRAIVARSTIPVVMLSAATEEGAKTTLEALSIGAIDFIPKAKNALLIHETLLAAVQAKSARPRLPAPPSPGQAAAQTFRTPPRMPVLRRSDMRILIIGSSTGGPQALQRLIGALPANLPVPVVVAQHMPAQFTAALAGHLDEVSPLKVSEAKDGDPLVPGRVLIAPGGMHIRVSEKAVIISPDRGESMYRPSVGVLAKSVLGVFHRHALGVMLTGMGNDGGPEFLLMKKAGAQILTQDQASSVVWGMPRAVAESGAADEILPLDEMAGRIRHLLGC